MIKNLFLPVCLFISIQINAQLPEDAIRMGWTIPSGTARQQAIGGAMGSLGGELSALFVNPAGLGMYKTGEFVLSPGISFLKGKSEFRGTKAATDRSSKFTFGTSGAVWGYSDRNSRWAGKAFSIGVNRTANFNNTIRYNGLNNYSSFTEPIANEFFDFYTQQKQSNPSLANKIIIDNALNSPDISLQTKMALYTYLVDIDTTNGQNTIFSRAERVVDLNQENTITTKGGITEVAFGFAGNMDNKLFLGGSIGVPIVNYERTLVYRESDIVNTQNNFNYSRFEEEYTSKGIGINAKLGLIFKPADFIRIGLAMHTPSMYGLKDNFSSKLVTDVEQLFAPASGVDSVGSTAFSGGQDPGIKYDLLTPWKFMLSGSYVFREAEDITTQKGFITADVEYATYKSSQFSAADESVGNDYYKDVNSAVKQIYKNAFNFRVGGELKFKTLMTRLGFARYGKPYNDKNLKARKMNISGGVGYRNKGVFVDLTYIHSLNKDVNFPYRLDPPRSNTFADLRESNGNVLVTVGLKF